MKLSKYTNNLFATHATLDAALSYAQDVANGSDNPAAVMTAVQAVLNTAISMHHAELAAVNRPLIELIDARVAAALGELKESLEDMESNLDDKITEAVNDIDLDDKMQGWFDSNFDIQSCLSGLNINVTFD
jgi:hypothetical protein